MQAVSKKRRRRGISVAHDVSRGNRVELVDVSPRRGRHILKYDYTADANGGYAAAAGAFLRLLA